MASVKPALLIGLLLFLIFSALFLFVDALVLKNSIENWSDY